MQTAFVTGGTGFLGLNLVELLKGEGWRVVAIHRSGSSIERLKELGAELVPVGLDDTRALAAAMPEGVDAVFHVAGDLSMWRGNDARQYKVNVEGTRNVVEAALERGARRFIHTSSVAAYGLGNPVVDERTPSTALESSNGYFRTKWLGEQEVRKGIQNGLDAVIMNPGNIMGPYDTTSWARMFRLLKDGKLPGVPPGSGSFCHVREVAGAHLSAVAKGRSGENYLLGGTDATYVELVRIMADLLGKKAPGAVPSIVLKSLAQVNDWVSHFTKKEPDISPGNAELVCASWRIDSSKAMSELGFHAVALREMTEDSHKWLVAKGLL